MGDHDSWRRTLLDVSVIGSLVPLLVLTLLLLPPVLGYATGPCNDDLAFDGPAGTFSIAYDETTAAATIQFDSSDTLTAEWTDALFVTVTAEPGGETTRYPLANSSAAFPVSPGDRFTIHNVTVDGRALADGDVIRVVWRGSQEPLPSYCPNSRGNSTTTVTLGKEVVS